MTAGAPDYLEWMRNHPQFKSVLTESHLEYSDAVRDAVLVSTYQA